MSAGTYTGLTFTYGYGGVSVYVDSDRRVYIEGNINTPGAGVSYDVGISDNLDGYLTGLSIVVAGERYRIGGNASMFGSSAIGFGVGNGGKGSGVSVGKYLGTLPPFVPYPLVNAPLVGKAGAA